jgi:hypothetical protein
VVLVGAGTHLDLCGEGGRLGAGGAGGGGVGDLPVEGAAGELPGAVSRLPLGPRRQAPVLAEGGERRPEAVARQRSVAAGLRVDVDGGPDTAVRQPGAPVVLPGGRHRPPLGPRVT